MVCFSIRTMIGLVYKMKIQSPHLITWLDLTVFEWKPVNFYVFFMAMKFLKSIYQNIYQQNINWNCLIITKLTDISLLSHFFIWLLLFCLIKVFPLIHNSYCLYYPFISVLVFFFYWMTSKSNSNMHNNMWRYKRHASYSRICIEYTYYIPAIEWAT